MEKELSSYLQISAEDFLLHATKFDLKPLKPALKTLVCRIDPSSNLSASLPLALQASISRSIDSYKRLLESKSDAAAAAASPFSPPKKQVLRSSRRRKNAEGSGGEDESGSKGNSKKQFLVQSLEIYAYMLSLCISHPKNAFLDSDLLLSVQALHDSLVVFESSQDLQSAIANLCEEWWKGQLPGRETLISQSLPFLVSRSLTLLKKVDAHRVYALREAFSLLDFDDESIEDLKLLLVRCIVTPLYYKTEEGRRFIAYLFGLSEQFTKEALAIIRSQIPLGRKSALEAYADIVFRGWKVVEGSSKNELENVFLQNLVEGAIHASSPSLAASIRRIIGGFVNQRTTDGVEKLLFRLSEPVIFRSLQVANSNVRQNALHLLLDLFPLEDPGATKEDKDAMLDKQFFLLERLLQDECPGVRVVAVEGSCRILHLFWEIIPSSAITKTIANIVDDISHDVASEVRLSTLNGIMHMLGNPQTHEILKVLLPRLGDLFSDPVLAVRMAISDLLLALRDIRTFQFHKVVDIDALLSSLANDQPSVARKIARLLIPSYFPSKVTIEEACNRCITLIKRSPNAGARFCEFALAEGSSAKSIMELVKALVNLVTSPNDLVSGVIEGVIDAAANLCKSLASEKTCKAELMLLFSGQKLKQLFAAAVTKHAQATVLDIASIVSPDNGIALTLTREYLDLKCPMLAYTNSRRVQEMQTVWLMMVRSSFTNVVISTLKRIYSLYIFCFQESCGDDSSLYPQLEKSLQDLELSEDARNALEKAKTMLHSACLIDIVEENELIAGASFVPSPVTATTSSNMLFKCLTKVCLSILMLSPVTILTVMPADLQTETDSLTPGRTGSFIPTIPRQVNPLTGIESLSENAFPISIVPVLSLHMVVEDPIVSQAARWRTSALSFIIFFMAKARLKVTAKGSPSGTATTTIVTATAKYSSISSISSPDQLQRIIKKETSHLAFNVHSLLAMPSTPPCSFSFSAFTSSGTRYSLDTKRRRPDWSGAWPRPRNAWREAEVEILIGRGSYFTYLFKYFSLNRTHMTELIHLVDEYYLFFSLYNLDASFLVFMISPVSRTLTPIAQTSIEFLSLVLTSTVTSPPSSLSFPRVPSSFSRNFVSRVVGIFVGVKVWKLVWGAQGGKKKRLSDSRAFVKLGDLIWISLMFHNHDLLALNGNVLRRNFLQFGKKQKGRALAVVWLYCFRLVGAFVMVLNQTVFLLHTSELLGNILLFVIMCNFGRLGCSLIVKNLEFHVWRGKFGFILIYVLFCIYFFI
ncbi:hypothetical protein Scep_000513 [Stephania cephalantha]|uniref:Uncharacterized protein n=1 Tax=Stephania cephalantha TaxID=152367 RepID=A0AAP0Q2I7_9MAGN